MLGLGDEPQLIVAGDPPLPEDRLVLPQLLAVDDQQLVLVELHFLRNVRD